jgi:hypothetical protein
MTEAGFVHGKPVAESVFGSKGAAAAQTAEATRRLDLRVSFSLFKAA